MDSEISAGFFVALLPLAFVGLLFTAIILNLVGVKTSTGNNYTIIERFISAPVVHVSGENALLTNGHIINSYWCSPRDGTLVTLAQPGDRFVIQTERKNGSINECAVKILFPRTRKAAG